MEEINKTYYSWLKYCILCGKEPNILEELEMIKGLCNYDMNWVKYIFEQHHNYRYWIRLNKLERLPESLYYTNYP